MDKGEMTNVELLVEHIRKASSGCPDLANWPNYSAEIYCTCMQHVIQILERGWPLVEFATAATAAWRGAIRRPGGGDAGREAATTAPAIAAATAAAAAAAAW